MTPLYDHESERWLIGALLTENVGIKTVLIPAALLIVAALAMFERREEEKTE